MTMDASMLAAKTVRDYVSYLEDTDFDWIDYYEAPHLSPRQWLERENPCDPDTDA